jgi:hypothetical protein
VVSLTEIMRVKSSKHVCIISLILLVILMLALWEAIGASAQIGVWTEPVNISQTSSPSWFPDLAVDSQGNVHVMWCETTDVEEGEYGEQVYYSMWDGQTWSTPNDIVPPSPDIVRNAIATDAFGNLHLLFGGSVYRNLSIYYTQTSPASGWLATSWSEPRLVSINGNSYMADIAVDSKGVIHAIFDDRGEPLSDTRPGYADIFYRRSSDGGKTWSYPANLSRSPTGSSRMQMEIDSNDNIHVVWDEGWDKLSGQGEPVFSTYISSSDGGESWSSPTSFSYPEGTNAQLAVGIDGQGGVVVVWRATSRPEIYCAHSSDHGASWSPPMVIPNIFARPWTGPFDMYDMATDSGGHVHLVVVGRLSPEEDRLGVYHLEWDGTSWSPPSAIYRGAGFPEYPKIVISEGNKLHVAWFVREASWEGANYEVWYSSSQSASPVQTPVPPPTSTPTPTATPVATATPTATPYPTLAPVGTALPDGLYTESDDLTRLLIGLAPVLILATAIFAVRFGWLRRSSGR